MKLVSKNKSVGLSEEKKLQEELNEVTSQLKSSIKQIGKMVLISGVLVWTTYKIFNGFRKSKS